MLQELKVTTPTDVLSSELITEACKNCISNQECKYDNKELKTIRAKVVQATVKWIRIIAENSQYAVQNYTENNSLLYETMWYPEDLLYASQESNDSHQYDLAKERIKRGYASTAFFNKIPLSKQKGLTIYRPWEFLAKPSKLPSKIFSEAIYGFTLANSGMACSLALYGALFDVLGKKKFNVLFGKQNGQRINVGYSLHELQPLRYFLRSSENNLNNNSGEIGHRKIRKGQIIEFKGVDAHLIKHPFSEWHKLITVCTKATDGNQLFVGLGTDPKGLSEQEITVLFWTKFKENPLKIKTDPLNGFFFDENPPFKENKILDKALEKIYFAHTKVQGFQKDSSHELIVEIIHDLIKLPLSEVSMDFVKKHPINIERFSKMPTSFNFSKLYMD